MFSFSYYHNVVKAPFGFSMKYFLVFSLLLGLAITTIGSAVTIQLVQPFLERIEKRAHNLYPDELVLTIKSGELSTNATEPLRFPIPFELFTEVPPAIPDREQQYLVTIDTKASIDDYKKYQSVVLLTKTNAVVLDDNGGYRVYPFKKIDDLTVNKQKVNEVVDKLLPYLKYIPVLIAATLFVIFVPLMTLMRLLSLLFLSLVLLIPVNIMNLSFSFKKVYQIGLHALTLPTLIQIVMVTFDLNPPIPFFNSLLFLLYCLIILAELKKTPTTPTILSEKSSK